MGGTGVIAAVPFQFFPGMDSLITFGFAIAHSLQPLSLEP
jgi:hypothetical protein